MSHDDFAFEHKRGLPKLLPRGERVIWQGAPAWRPLARRAFKTRAVMIWFGALIAFRLGQGIAEGAPLGDTGIAVAIQLGLGAAAVGILSLLAYGYAKTTVYTITNRRVVIRFGLAIDMAINLPFKHIAAAASKIHKDGTADLPLATSGEAKIAYLHLWPNARPWRFTKPEPMMRAVPEGREAARILADALHAYAEAQARGVEPGAEDAGPVVEPADHDHETARPAATRAGADRTGTSAAGAGTGPGVGTPGDLAPAT